MKKLFVAAMMAALCSVPGVSRAATPGAPRPVVAPALRDEQARPASDPEVQRPEGEASDYAAREKAAPKLGEFSGGNGIYIGGGALLAAILIVLLITAL